MDPPRTLDGRYLVLVGKAGARLWRASNPHLSEEERQSLVDQLVIARRAVRGLEKASDELVAARAAVDRAKRALGERGAPWWTDGAPDMNRMLVKNTPYWDWWADALPPPNVRSGGRRS